MLYNGISAWASSLKSSLRLERWEV